MSSQPRIEIQGQAPFKQSGVYEAQISITSTKPSDDEIKTKQFSHLWQGHFHLSVKDGIFSEIIGDSKNPLPSSINDVDTIWVIVNDLFSSLYSIFDVTLRKTSDEKKSTVKKEKNDVITEPTKTKRFSKPTSNSGSPGPTGVRGTTGLQGTIWSTWSTRCNW